MINLYLIGILAEHNRTGGQTLTDPKPNTTEYCIVLYCIAQYTKHGIFT